MMSIVPLEPGVGRRQLQGSAAAQHPPRPAGQAHGRPLRQEGRIQRHASPAWASAPARPSRCCRRRTPPATGSRWCSACRCASRSTREQLQGQPAARRPVDGRRGRRHASRTARCWPTRRAPRALDADAGLQPARRRRRGRGAARHRAPTWAARAPRRRARRPPAPAARRRAGRGLHAVARQPDLTATRTMATAHRLPPAPTAARRLGPRLGHDRAVGRDLHERARHVDRQRVAARDRGRPRRQPEPGHLGHHQLRRGQRHRRAADRLAVRSASARCGCSWPACCCSCIASWLCGLAPNMTTLIAFRALQGFVAGPMIPLSQTLLLSSYPRAKAGPGDGDVGHDHAGRAGDGAAAGRLDHRQHLAGRGSSTSTSRSACWPPASPGRIYRKRESATRKLPIDAVGLALLVLWVGALQLMLDKGKEHDWFHSPADRRRWPWWRWWASPSS